IPSTRRHPLSFDAMASLRTIRTMCPMNCHPTLCGMLADVEEGKLVAVRGDPDNPDSRGFLCIRGQAAREIIGNPGRLLHPMRRTARSGSWQRATWEDALDRIAERARAVGPAALGTWSGHGFFANDYGTRVASELLRRFSNLYGCQWWNPMMICWGLGAFGLGLTGALRVSTKEDMGANAALVVLWGANLASQPNTGRYLTAAKRRGAYVVTVDVRRTEASAQSNETLLLRPGTDAALAHHLAKHDVAWAAATTGVDGERIVSLARRYASTKPAMILLGGSSMHKGAQGWQGARAVACLPALTGNFGIPGGGLGPRHGAAAHGQGLSSIAARDRRPPGDYVPNQMSRITEALADGRVRVLMLFGTDMVSSFADAGRVGRALERLELLASYDLFMHDTARRHADVILPATAWLEDTGCKSTNTHLYLMPKALEPEGEARPPTWVLRELARRLDVRDFFPWQDDSGPLDAILDHPTTGHATVAALASEGGIRPLHVSHVAYPDLRFDTPSGKIEFFSERAARLGLPALPVFESEPQSEYPLELRTGRTLTQFHGFYDHGRALPTLAAADPEPRLWISSDDAGRRALRHGEEIRIFNGRGEMRARAFVTDRVPPGTVWMRDGWEGLNTLTSGGPVLPDAAVNLFEFSSGQA